MRLALFGLLLPLAAACASTEPAPQAAPQVAAPAAAEIASIDPAAPAARAAPTTPPNSTVEIADKVAQKKVCWTEIVTGTRGRKQTVCRTERSERDTALMQKDFKDFQNRASSTQPQIPGP